MELTQNTSLKNPILWALDPFDTTFDTPKLSRITEELSLTFDAQIEIVYVLSRKSLNWTGEFSRGWIRKYEPITKEALEKIADELKLHPRVTILSVPQKSTLSLDVKRLLDYAKKVKARAIVVNTHKRKGLERWYLGSFAETALLHTKVPLIMLSPHSDWHDIKRILIPTDFSKESYRSLKQMLPELKKMNSEVVLFHKLPDAIEPIMQMGAHMAGGGWVSIYQYMENESGEREKDALKWQKWLSDHGISCVYDIEEKPGPVVESILRKAEEYDCQLIAVQSHVSPIASTFIGSVARQLVRQSDRPVMVTHS